MIIGIGTDIVAVQRLKDLLKQRGMRALEKILHPDELALCLSRYGDILDDRHARFLAKRFAAKEAVVKAMGTGFSGGIGLRDISVLPNEVGAPCVCLYGKAQDAVTMHGRHAMHISISDEKEYAVAYVVIVK